MPVAHGPAPDHDDDGALSGPPVVFVSYCRADAEWLRRFAVMLKPEISNRPPVQLWHDTLIGPGQEWRPEVDDAIGRTVVALLLVTPDFLASDFIMQTELAALQAAAAELVPVLVRACSNWAPVDVLGRVQWARDPGRDKPVAALRKRDVDGAIAQTARAVCAALDRRLGACLAAPPVAEGGRGPRVRLPAIEPTSELGALDGVPELPHGFVARDELDELRETLVGAGEGGVAITGGRGLGIHGQGGIGKTVLAAALAHDGLVRRSFADGVFWVTLGERPDLAGMQIDLLQRLGAPSDGIRSALDGVLALRDALSARRSLVVVDDVWTAAGAQAFDATGPAGRVLYTTRDPRTLRDVRARVQQIDVLGEDAARDLLANVANCTADELPDDADRVLAVTRRVALALALVAAAVGRGGRGWREVADELEVAAGTFLEHPYADVFKAMGLAVTALKGELALAHESLAVFPEDARVPAATVGRLWAHLFDRTPDQTQEWLALLAERELIGVDADAITMHDLQRDFLLLRAPSVGLLHHELLLAHRSLLPSDEAPWRALPRDEPYIRQHLQGHLVGAGDVTSMTELATDLGWLAIRAFEDGPHAAEHDVRRAAAVVPDDPAVAWVLERVTRWGHLLSGHARLQDLAATLWTRTAHRPASLDRGPLSELLLAGALTPCWGLRDADPAQQRVLEGHTGGVLTLAFSPDGRQLAGAAEDHTVRVWDTATGIAAQTLHAHADGVSAVAFSPDGRLLASAWGDGTVRLWDAATGAAGRVLHGHAGAVTAVAFRPDGLLASASEDGTVRLWDPATGAASRVLDGHTDVVRAVAFSPDGGQLASASEDGTVRFWDSTTGAGGRVLQEGDEMMVVAVAFSPDGAQLAAVRFDGRARLWDTATGAPGRRLEGHTDAVRALAFNLDGGQIGCGCADGTVRLLDTTTRSSSRVLCGHTDAVAAVAFSPDGRQLASASDDRTVRLWNTSASATGRVHDDHASLVNVVAFSPDGRQLASASDDLTVRLYDSATGTVGHVLEGHEYAATAIAFSPDGCELASASYDGTVRLWNTATGGPGRVLHRHTDPVTSVAFSPDGRLLASGWRDGKLRLSDPATGATGRVLDGHSRCVNAVAFSPDGRQLACAYEDGPVRLWDPATGAAGRVLDGDDKWVFALAFSPDGRQLAAAAYDWTVRLFDPATGAAGRVLDGHNHYLSAVAFGGDGLQLASASYDGTVRLWDCATATCHLSVRFGEPVGALAAHHRAVAIGLGNAVCCFVMTDPPAF